MKTFVIICAVAALNDAVAPGTALGNQGVNTPIFFDFFGEGSFSLRMRSVFHREAHCVIGEGNKKVGKRSKVRR